MRFLYVLIVLSFFSCAPKVVSTIYKTQGVLDYKEDVIVINLLDSLPAGAIDIGLVKIGDTGLSANCDWQAVIELAKTEARKVGGNAIKIIEHKAPVAFGSHCDRITAKILKIENKDYLNKLKMQNAEVVDTTLNYATLFVYRPKGFGVLVGYNLYLGDSLLCRVKHNFKKEIKITKKGAVTLWAKTESKETLPITIEHGKEYYLKCGVQMGILVGRPNLQLVEAVQGKNEFNLIQKK